MTASPVLGSGGAGRWWPGAALGAALVALAVHAAVPAAASALEPALASYLPTGVSYRADVPTPASVLGFEIGERPITPLELELYMRRLAEVSDRVVIEEQGRTHEGRPQLLLTFSAPGNLSRLEQLRQAHLRRSEGGAEAGEGADEATLVVWLAYSIHGDETSGSNAAPLVAYHLAAAQDAATEQLLARTVVLLDPSQNPDGMARFAQWAISQRSAQLVASPVHREKNEPWPGDRFNHYWFDLNRDWLAAEQPESQARVATFQRWRPHLVGDFHEMGSGGTYFFQPGVPERTHPLTPPRNQGLTAALARYHAAALDRAGRPYYTRETYDDFFYGKGSTYPDVQGGVGVLFEQATTAGHVIETPHGIRDFPTTIHNQFLTSLSTLTGAHALRRELVQHQETFYREARAAAGRGGPQGWVCAGERGRVDGLARLLRRHDVDLGAAPAAAAGGAAGEASFLIPARQRQSRLLEALLERRTELPTHVFYDISAWTLPLAWGVSCEPLAGRLPSPLAATPLGSGAPPAGTLQRAAGAVAYAFDWAPHLAPQALQRLLAADVVVHAAVRPLTLATGAGIRGFRAGALVVPVAGQELPAPELERLLAEVAATTGVDVWAIGSGLAAGGIDLGSPNVRPLEAPRPALVVGDGIQPTAAGALWHLLDRHFEVPVVLLDRSRLSAAALADVSHLLVPDGNWDDLSTAAVEAVTGWVRAGGVLVGFEAGARWAQERVLPAPEASSAKEPPEPPAESPAPPPLGGRYAAYDDATAERLIAGAIVELELDITHPLAFGYDEPRLAGFRGSTLQLAAPQNGYDLVARYSDRPVLAGFVSTENAGRLAGSPALLATRLGRGLVVRFADDPVFRGGWHGTERLVANALFFGGLVDERPPAPPR